MVVARSSLSFAYNFVRGRQQQQVIRAANMTTDTKLPVPPFSLDDAVKKVRMAEDAWNTRNPDKVRYPVGHMSRELVFLLHHCNPLTLRIKCFFSFR
jgi:hypothetical protein